MKAIFALVTSTIIALMTSTPARAAVVIQLVQNGQNTQVTGSGLLNLSSTVSFNSASVNGQTFLNLQANSGNSISFTGVIPTDPDRYDIDNVVRTGPIPNPLPPAEYLPILNDGGAHHAASITGISASDSVSAGSRKSAAFCACDDAVKISRLS